MKEKQYLDMLVESKLLESPQQMRIMTFNRIKHLNKVRTVKCPKTDNPAECNKKYTEKIAKLKERLKKQSGKILGVVPQTQKFVNKAENI